MNRSIARTGLAFVLTFVCVGSVALAAGTAAPSKGSVGLKDSYIAPDNTQNPVVRPFKLKGGGQIDLQTFSFNFAGQAAHLGQFTSTGQIDPYTFQIAGTMTAADGSTLDWVAAFAQGPLGEIEATFTIVGGTGRFVNASGTASGPVSLDPDFMFTINLDGTIAF